MMAIGNSIVVRIPRAAAKYVESYSPHTNMRGHRIDEYYIAFETYWAEAVYQ